MNCLASEARFSRHTLGKAKQLKTSVRLDLREEQDLHCMYVWPTNLIKQGEDAGGTALYEVQTALVILVLDKGPL